MHSLAVTEKRGAFKAWTVLLAIFAFSLSLLGTFLVRSGVLTSVHAFASDPTRGVFILAFLVVVVGSSLLLYSMRAAQVRSFVRFDLVSRETAMLMGNVFLVVSAASILLGTLYPLIIDAFTQGQNKISVGPPYFNSVFVPLMVPLVVVMGLGMLLRWKQDSTTALWQKVRWPVVISIVAGFGLTFLFMPAFHWGAVLTLTLAVWVAATVYESVRDRLGNSGRRLASLPRGYWGMVLGHLGVAVFIVGVGLTSIYSTEKDVSLRTGESYELGGYTFAFKGVENRDGPNFRANRGTVEITRDGEPVTVLYPEKRVYRVQTMPMTEAGIDAGLFRDLFVALGDPLGANAWAVRLYHKPFIRWIWLGSLIMGIGGILAASDRRYRVLARRERELAAGSGAAA
jgi:cytochrome c-type biogenesis protein CcmF